MGDQTRKLQFYMMLQTGVLVGVFTLFFTAHGVPVFWSAALAVLIFTLLFLLYLFLRLPFFIIPQIRGAVYVPSADERIQTMVKLLKLRKKDRVAELGSGDGRLVIALAKTGCQVDGFELNPILVKQSKQNLEAAGTGKNARIYWQSLWDVDFSHYTAVTVYGIPYMMKDLEKKLLRELPKGARVASNYFTFPSWNAVTSSSQVHLYQR